MVSRIGLTRLHSPDNKELPTTHNVDIVFVHGLFGHPVKTWSLKKENESLFWPQSLLPAVVPNSQIFTWGYDADVSGIFSSAGQSTIHELAGSLLSDLADLRDTPSRRRIIPLIFVVHSLGGIIVKDALNRSSSNEGTRWKEIAPATYGVIFLGTPHRGSTSASMGKMALHVSEVFTLRPNLKLLQGLEKHSEILDRLGDDFHQTILKHNLTIYSFREERETRRYKLFNIMVSTQLPRMNSLLKGLKRTFTQVVESDSAKIGHAKEECGIIPADHRNMTKYSGPEDIGFKRVSAQLRRWSENIRAVSGTRTLLTSRSDQQLPTTKVYMVCIHPIPLLDLSLTHSADLLESLNSQEARERLEEVKQAHPATFEWLFDPKQVPFLEWLQAGDELGRRPFWIQGKPGSGKSTLMKFALKNPQTLQALTGSRSEHWTFSSFFFHDRGSQAQKNLLAMLQELLHSILLQNTSFVQSALPYYNVLRDEQRTRHPRWPLTQLKNTIQAVFKNSLVRANLCLFLDALDEHAGENEELVGMIWNWITATDEKPASIRIKICLASRPWEIFKKNFGQCPQFAIHEHTRGDIEAYTTQRIRNAMYTSELSLAAANLIGQIVRDASGVFIWVRLVLDRVAQEIIDGTPFSILQEIVSQLPMELGELYRLTVKRIQSRYHPEAWIMFQTVLCSLKPLLLENLITVVESNLPLVQHDPSNFSEEHPMEEQGRRLNSRSGGLLEILPRSNHVQFIHQTVKDSLTASGLSLGFAVDTHTKLDKPIFAMNGYEFMLRESSVGAKKRTLRHLRDALVYAKLAEQSANEDPDRIGRVTKETQVLLERCAAKLRGDPFHANFFGDLPGEEVKVWEWLCSWVNLLPYGGESKYAVLPYVVATSAQLVRFIENRHHGKSSLSAEVEKSHASGSYLIGLAAVGPEVASHPLCDVQRSKMIEALSCQGCNVDYEIGMPLLVVESEFDAFSPDCPAHPTNLNTATPLTALIFKHLFSKAQDRAQDYLDIAETLIRTGASADVSVHANRNDKSSPLGVPMNLLEYCVRYGSAEWVRFLLAHGATETPRRIRTLADWASLRRDGEIIQTLRDYGYYERSRLGQSHFSPVEAAILAGGEILMSTNKFYPAPSVAPPA
ncbi:MAG: hypothetical protein LQ345_003915, partial [Seirophora villosa]